MKILSFFKKHAYNDITKRTLPTQALSRFFKEAISNVNNHAGKTNNNKTIQWFCMAFYDANKKSIKYTIIDSGKGIFNTLHIKPIEIGFEKKLEILHSVLTNTNEIIRSETKLGNRGGGLMRIYELFATNIISKLTICANDVYVSYSEGKQEEKKKLKNKFNGTMISIDINIE